MDSNWQNLGLISLGDKLILECSEKVSLQKVTHLSFCKRNRRYRSIE